MKISLVLGVKFEIFVGRFSGDVLGVIVCGKLELILSYKYWYSVFSIQRVIEIQEQRRLFEKKKRVQMQVRKVLVFKRWVGKEEFENKWLESQDGNQGEI